MTKQSILKKKEIAAPSARNDKWGEASDFVRRMKGTLELTYGLGIVE